jgi:ubiquinone/menaquinone biosynthesis C-methylase UbiE
VKRLRARDHREAYDYWATCFDDPALMNNREARHTQFKIGRLVEQLPLDADSHVLDVGPGDGSLFRAIASRVARCCGVDPSENAIARLRSLFEGAPNVEFAVGTSDRIPFDDDTFDVVVINSVILVLPDVETVDRTLGELVRVCRPGGTVFVGEVPFCAEGEGGIRSYFLRKIRELGLAGTLRSVYRTYLRPVLRGGPLVTAPLGKTLHFPAAGFAERCRRHGVEVAVRRHLEPRRPSLTRNDYVLRVPDGARGDRG